MKNLLLLSIFSISIASAASWISVKKELPPFDTYVLVCDELGVTTIAFRYSNCPEKNKWHLFYDGFDLGNYHRHREKQKNMCTGALIKENGIVVNEITTEGITHWMLLPKPPHK